MTEREAFEPTQMTAGDRGVGLWVQREDGVLLTRWGAVEVLLALQTYLATVPAEVPRTLADQRLNILNQLRLELLHAVTGAIVSPAPPRPSDDRA